MSQKLTVELSDELYTIIQHQATEANISPAQVASASLERYFHEQRKVRRGSKRTEAELRAACERFERHLGSVDLGYETGSDNEEIDADLEREYANVNETA
ncbi:MAG TPA: hypothetical protein VGE45_15015 [Chloroflexia bacterium]|jgi:predicted transcriptional regulator